MGLATSQCMQLVTQQKKRGSEILHSKGEKITSVNGKSGLDVSSCFQLSQSVVQIGDLLSRVCCFLEKDGPASFAKPLLCCKYRAFSCAAEDNPEIQEVSTGAVTPPLSLYSIMDPEKKQKQASSGLGLAEVLACLGAVAAAVAYVQMREARARLDEYRMAEFNVTGTLDQARGGGGRRVPGHKK